MHLLNVTTALLLGLVLVPWAWSDTPEEIERLVRQLGSSKFRTNAKQPPVDYAFWVMPRRQRCARRRIAPMRKFAGGPVKSWAG